MALTPLTTRPGGGKPRRAIQMSIEDEEWNAIREASNRLRLPVSEMARAALLWVASQPDEVAIAMHRGDAVEVRVQPEAKRRAARAG